MSNDQGWDDAVAALRDTYGAPDAAGWLERNKPKGAWPDPTPEMLADPLFEAVWQCIKTWDINVPGVYEGYCGATGNHVRAILDAIRALKRHD